MKFDIAVQEKEKGNKLKKKIAGIVAAILLLVLLFPIKAHLDDGGSVIYMSIASVYKITKIKTFDNIGMTVTMKEGLRIELFGREVYERIDREYLSEQKDWGEENGLCYFDAEIKEITENHILAESITDGVGAIRSGTPVAFDASALDEQMQKAFSTGDNIRIIYNDKRVRVNRPQWCLWLEVVFSVLKSE